MGRRGAKGRDVSGILLLNKPGGLTSNAALQRVKRLFFAKKAGHTGSLDPIATGVLPICLGEATKVSGFLLNATKGYFSTVKLGQRTDTADIEGEVIETRPVPVLNEAGVLDVLAQFTGDIEQLPPMYSALKRDGQPLYKLARQGIEVERELRSVTIYSLELLALREDELDIQVLCSKGTYIRTLAEDIGEVLGCGAHVKVLHRTQVGEFAIDKTITLEQLDALRDQGPVEELDSLLLTPDSALDDWPLISLTDDMARYIQQGQAVFVPKAPTEGLVRLYAGQDGAGQDRFLGIGHILDDGRVAPKRLMAQ